MGTKLELVGSRAPLDLEILSASFRLALAAENKFERTIRTYLEAVRLLTRHLQANDMPLDPGSISKDHLRSFFSDLLRNFKPATASNRYRALQAFWKWAVEEGEVHTSPMEGMKPPKVPVHPPPVYSETELARLISACEGTSFEARRDAALVRLLD